MKNLTRIILTLTLSAILVVVGSGVTFRHCDCSGKTSMVLAHIPGDDQQPMQKGCMTMQSFSISQTTQMQQAVFDFNVLQPLVAIVNDWSQISMMPQEVATEKVVLTCGDVSPPPRQYLRKLRRLII